MKIEENITLRMPTQSDVTPNDTQSCIQQLLDLFEDKYLKNALDKRMPITGTRILGDSF